MLNNKNKIEIALLELSDPNRAVLEFYFDSAGKDFYKVVEDESKAEAFIIDYDFPEAADHLVQLQNTYKKPAIVLSVKEQNIPATVFLQKPLSAQALTDAATKLIKIHEEETEAVEENTLLEAELALARTGAAISATLDNRLDVTDSSTSDDSMVVEAETSQINNSTTDSHTEFTETQIDEDVAESENEVDLLLKSLMSSADGSDIEENSETFELKASDEADDEQSPIVDKNFTLHHEKDSKEDTFANTLEVDYLEVKTNQLEEEIKDEALDSTQELTLELEDNLSSEIESVNIDEYSEDAESTLSSNLEPKDPDADSEIMESDLDALLKEVASETDTAINDIAEKEVIANTAETEQTEEATELNDDTDTANIEADFVNTTATDEAVLETNNALDSDLQSLLNEVRAEAVEHPNKSSSATNQNNNYQRTNAEKRWAQLCGEHHDIKKPKDLKTISFNPNNHLLSVVLNQIASINDNELLFRLKYNDLIIVLGHATDKIYCNLPLTSDEYSEICFEELDSNALKIHDLDYSEIRLYRTKMEGNSDKAHSVESFIWSTSLLTSRGRLPEGTDINKPVGLKVWPNLTRLELMPYAMNMAAVFSKHPGSLLEIPAWLKIHQCYVFAFYNAALSLDMIEQDSSKLKSSKFSFGKKGSSKASTERGFFGRLLKRLKS